MRLAYRLFQLLPLDQQLAVVRTEGRYLAQRWAGTDTVALFALFSFFCEVQYHAETNTLLRTQCFAGSGGLEAYLRGISLRGLREPGTEES